MSGMEQYLDMFIEESTEHLQIINSQLLELEKEPNNISIVQEIFRSAHTLKGSAGAMGYEDLANLTHKMENVLDGIRHNKIQVTSAILDVIFSSVDYLEQMVNSIASGGDGKANVAQVVEDLQKIESGSVSASSSTNNTSPKVKQENSIDYDQYEQTIISEAKEQNQNIYEIVVTLDEGTILKGARAFMVFQALEELGEIIKSLPSIEHIELEEFDLSFCVVLITNQSEDVIKERLLNISEISNVDVSSVERNVQQEETKVDISLKEVNTEQKEMNASKESIKEIPKSPATPSKSIRVNIERLDSLMNLFEELIIDRGRLEQIAINIKNTDLTETVQRMTRVSGDLQNIILNMRMVQVDTVFNRFPRMVRQLSKELGKDINFVIEGEETELDRTVIDDIGDPLVHLLRNALDHGIESPEERVAKGKPKTGTIILKAYHKGNMVFIDIEDDGRGINQEKVIKKAIENGVITKDESLMLSSEDINQLIFASGFSTAETVSDISGRGVGLDVVRSNIEKLSGSVRISSEEGKGSVFSIELPLTLSIIASMLVKVKDENYAVPLTAIVETAMIKTADIQYVHNQKVILFRDKIIPLIFLDEYFQINSGPNEKNTLSVVIIQKGHEIVGLVVDQLIGQQEIVLKSLGEYMKDTHSISGATILGDGTVALIIDTSALIGKGVSKNGR